MAKAADQRNKSQAHAEYMKRMGIRRTTAMCPLSCGGMYSVTRTNGLMEHFANCMAGTRKRNRLLPGRKGRR